MFLNDQHSNTRATASYMQWTMKLVSYTRCKAAYFKSEVPYPSYLSHLESSKLCCISPQKAHDGTRLRTAMARFYTLKNIKFF